MLVREGQRKGEASGSGLSEQSLACDLNSPPVDHDLSQTWVPQKGNILI